jgi:hypothetical protein
MKKITFLLVWLFSSSVILTQVPQTISWQGIFQDADAKNQSGT